MAKKIIETKINRIWDWKKSSFGILQIDKCMCVSFLLCSGERTLVVVESWCNPKKCQHWIWRACEVWGRHGSSAWCDPKKWWLLSPIEHLDEEKSNILRKNLTIKGTEIQFTFLSLIYLAEHLHEDHLKETGWKYKKNWDNFPKL